MTRVSPVVGTIVSVEALCYPFLLEVTSCSSYLKAIEESALKILGLSSRTIINSPLSQHDHSALLSITRHARNSCKVGTTAYIGRCHPHWVPYLLGL